MKTKLLNLGFALFLGTIASFAQTVSLTGAGVGGWNNPPLLVNLMSTTDNVNFTLSNVQITGSGGGAEVKFMINSDWGTTYGYTSLTGAPGALWQSGVANAAGTNIPGVAGFWNVAYNLTTGVYSFSPGVNPNAIINITSTGTPIPMVTTNGTNYESPSTTVTAGTYFFTQPGSPNQWGNAAFPSGTATIGGSGVVVPAGTYNITFDKSNGSYAFTTTSVGMTGTGSPSGTWGVDAVMTTTDAINYRLNNAIINGGIMLFRDNGSYNIKFGTNGPAGTNTFPSGIAVQNGTDLLTVSGTYNITFNRSTGAYNFENVLATTSFQNATFKVTPNPTNTSWNFSTSKEAISAIEVYDILGKLVVTTNQVSIDATNLKNGIYFAKITSNNVNETVKLVKN